MTGDAWVGVDVACAKDKRLPIVICVRKQGRLVPLNLRSDSRFVPPRGMGNARVLDPRITRDFAKAARDYLMAAADENNVTIRRIGIDAPSSYCSEGTKRRASEIAMDKAGISCFATPTKRRFAAVIEKARRHVENSAPVNRIPHANQLWMLAGFALFQELSKIAECREVYPQATVQVMGAGDVYKSKKEGLTRQMREASVHTGWPDRGADTDQLRPLGFAASHDHLDAYLAAWVASLDEHDLLAFGSPPNDVIWVPRIDTTMLTQSADNLSTKRRRALNPNESKPCPGCGEHLFKRWPLGWDAHAAYRCSALDAAEPEERKKEFRRRFMSAKGN